MERTPTAMATLATSLIAMLAASCAGRASSATSAVAIRLVDLYKPEVLHGSASVATRPPKKIEWRFDGPAPTPPPKDFTATRGWEAGIGISGFTIRDGRLTARSSTEYPVIQIERTQDLDNRDQFYAVEIRMKASAGNNLSIITRGSGPVPWPDVERGLKRGPWAISTALTPGNEMQTYTLTSAAPLNTSRIRRILIRPTDVAGATFEIESVRLVQRKEYLAGVPSGVGFQGLGEIYR